MITVKIREIAKDHNIKNAYQFQKFTGFSPAMAARLWKGDWKNANLKTLNTLCHLFKCRLTDILELTPDKPEE